MPMSLLEWSDALALDLPAMDDTHREFVDLLAQVSSADEAGLMACWQALVDHTDEHFGREDHWMRSTGFSSSNCHSMQHQVVLQVMREGLLRGHAGQQDLVRQMARELAVWFPQHAQSMDAALALHLRGVGFDPASGVVHMPASLPRGAIHGCGGATCSDPAAQTEPVAETA
jgi:hemerythrin-like metal-binding protein